MKQLTATMAMVLTCFSGPMASEIRTGHTTCIHTAAYDARGDLLVTAGYDGTVKLWNGHAGRLLGTLHHGRLPVGRAVALSPDGRRLLTALDTRVLLWDVPSRRVLWEVSIPGPDANEPDNFDRLELTPDGRYGLAEDSYRRPSVLLDLRMGKVMRTVPSLTELTSDGHLVMPGPEGSEVVPVEGGRATSLPVTTPWALSPDGTRLAGRHGKTTRVVRLTGQTVMDVPLIPTGLVWSADSSTLAVATEQETTVLSTRTGKRLSHFQDSRPSAFLPGNTRLLGDSVLWDVPHARSLAAIKENSWIGRWVLSPAGDTFVGETSKLPRPGDRPNGILPPSYLWNARTGRRLVSLGADVPWVDGIAETDGVFVLALNGRRWDVASQGPCFSGLAMFNGAGMTFAPRQTADDLTAGGNRLATRDAWAVSLCRTDGAVVQRMPTEGTAVISPDGKSMILNTAVWDLQTLRRRAMDLPGSPWAFTPEGQLLCVGDDQMLREVVSLPDGKRLRRLDVGIPLEHVTCFDAGRHYLITGRELGASLYDLVSGRLAGESMGRDSIGSVALSPDEHLAAIGPNYGPLELWDVRSGTEAGHLVGHDASVTALHFSKNGRRLYSGGADGRLCIWDVAGRRLLGTLVVMGSRPDWVVYTPDGRCDGTPVGIERLEGHGPRIPGLLRTLMD